MNSVVNRSGNARLLRFIHKCFEWLRAHADFIERHARVFAGDVELGNAVGMADYFAFVAFGRFGVEFDAFEANSAGFEGQNAADCEFMFGDI